MAHIEDRWFKEITGPDGKTVTVRTDRHGKGQQYRVRLPASRGDRKWFGDGRKRDNAESAGI